jgi:hypothetical protein
MREVWYLSTEGGNSRKDKLNRDGSNLGLDLTAEGVAVVHWMVEKDTGLATLELIFSK